MKPLALIFSSLQAVTFLEAVDLGYVDPGVVLLGGTWRPDDETDQELRAAATVYQLGPKHLARFGFAQDLVLGDPYSGIGQLILILARPKRLTVVEDGAATYRAIQQYQSSEPLIRAQERRYVRTLLGRRTQRTLADLGARGDLQWVTHRAPLHPLAGCRTHSFSRLRRISAADDTSAQRLVVGSALAQDGYVRTADYLTWLRKVLTASEETVFLPHRREPRAALELAEQAGVTIDTTSIPLERRLLHYSGLRKVYCLPTTGAMTTSALLPDVELHCTPVPTDCWNPGAPAGQRDLVRMVESLVFGSDGGNERKRDE